MPKVTFVKKARKDNPVAKKGESYFWWQFRYGPKRFSKTRPRPSQLTQSPYYSTVRSLVERVEDFGIEDKSDLEVLVEEINSELECLQEECQSSLDNMPDSLQYSPTGEMLQERIDACESAISELGYIDEFDFDEEPFDEDGYDSDEEREADRAEHNKQEAERRADELSQWIDEQRDAVIEAINSCEV